jgi:DNA-binding transcriptional LysR family regulator
MTIDLRQLRHFLAIDQHGSFGRAAAALGMTQPALSRSIQGLEHRVGNALFARSKRGVTLTDEGHLLLQRARELVQAADELDREVRRSRVPGAGHLTVGTGPYPGMTIIPDTTAWFMAAHPLVRVRLLLRGWEELLPRLRSREMALFVGETSTFEQEPDFDIEPLPRHPVYFVARAGHPLARRATVRAIDTHAYPFVTISRLPPRVLDPMLNARETLSPRGRPFPALEFGDLAGVTRIVERSDAISALSATGVARELEHGTLVLLGREPWMETGYAIVRLKGEAPSPAATAFCAFIREAESRLARSEAKVLAQHAPKSERETGRPRKSRA